MQSLALYRALLTDYLTSLELKRFVTFLPMASAAGGLVGGVSLRFVSRVLATPESFLALASVYGLIAAMLLRLGKLGGELEAGAGTGQPREGLLLSWACSTPRSSSDQAPRRPSPARAEGSPARRCVRAGAGRRRERRTRRFSDLPDRIFCSCAPEIRASARPSGSGPVSGPGPNLAGAKESLPRRRARANRV